MEKRIETVVVEESEIRELEKAFYELQGDQSTIAFCMGQPSVNFEAIKEYRELMQVENAKVELLKRALANKYKPENVDLSKFNYRFDFTENQVIFEEN